MTSSPISTFSVKEDTVQPFEDGSLCWVSLSGAGGRQKRQQRRRATVTVHSRDPLKYKAIVAGAMCYPVHSQLVLISTPAQLRQQQEKHEERERKEREHKEHCEQSLDAPSDTTLGPNLPVP